MVSPNSRDSAKSIALRRSAPHAEELMVCMTHRWREVDSNHRFRRERDGPGAQERGPAADHHRSRDDLCLMTLSSVSVRDLLSPTAERSFARAGPMVRIHFPPARSLLRTSLSGAHVFPNGKHDDQADSTAQFLDWFKKPFPGQNIFEFYQREAEKLKHQREPEKRKPPRPVNVRVQARLDELVHQSPDLSTTSAGLIDPNGVDTGTVAKETRDPCIVLSPSTACCSLRDAQ